MTAWWRGGGDDIAEEIRQHLEEAADALVERGIPRDEAERIARRNFGNVTLVEERSREVWHWRWARDCAADVRYALRQLRRTPSFASAAVLTLAVGIGASTTIFSLARAGLINPLPFPEPERLVSVNEIVPLIADRPLRLPAPDLVDFQEQSRSFTAVAGWTPRTYELSGARESERVQAARVTASLFDVLRVSPAIGRPFTPEEDRDGVALCVISDGLWQRWFGASPDVLSATIDLDRRPYRVIGVMPRGFEFPLRDAQATQPTDVWVPMAFTATERAARADSWDYNGVARLKPGVTIAQASEDVNAIAQRILSDLLSADQTAKFSFTALVRPLAPQVSTAVRPLVLALAGAVACLLLIACVNVANLLLARGAHRQRELAVRVALGAGRGRLLRQLMTEALLLALIASVIGSVVALWSTAAIASLIPPRFAVLGLARVDLRALAFAVALGALTALAAGILPGLSSAGTGRAGRLNLRADTGGAGLRRLRSALVVSEIALALVLMVGAGLLARTFQQLLRTDAGFAPDSAVAAFLSLPEGAYPDAPRERQIYRAVLERLHAGAIDYAAVGSTLPLSGFRSERVFWPDGYTAPPGAGYNIAGLCAVSPEYFQAIGATLRRGRFFTPADVAGGEPVAMVSQSLAGRYWAGRDPIGKRVKWGSEDSARPWLTVIGVVSDLKQGALDGPGAMQIFVPAEQLETSYAGEQRDRWTAGHLRSMYVVARGRQPVATMAARVRQAVGEVDSTLAVARLAPLAETVAESAAPQRFNMLLMGGFAAIAVLLAGIGLYGLVAYSVAQRTREIGIRMAMGAVAPAVVRMIVREGVVLAGIGIGLGAAGALALAPTLRALLYGVDPLDPATFVSVAALLFVVSVGATYVPARRATAIDPTEALRAE